MYSSLIRSVLEYASPVWANLPEYLSLLIEGVQKKALEIIFPGLPYSDALVRCGLRTLSDRRALACTKFIHGRELGTRVFLLTCYHSAQLCPMDIIYVQAPSERISPWPLLTVSTILLHIDIPSNSFMLMCAFVEYFDHSCNLTEKLRKE